MLFALLMRLLAGHKGRVAAIIALQLVQTAGILLLPTINAAIIDDGIVAGNTPEIFRLGTDMAFVAAVQAAAAVAAGYLGAVVAMTLGQQLRAEVFTKIQSLSSQEVAAFGTQSLVTRATNDTQQIQSFAVLVFTMLVAAPVMAVGGVYLAWQQDIVLSSIVIIIMPVLLLIMYLIVRRLVPLYRDGQELLDATGQILREQIIGANVIRSFVRQGHETRRFARANTSLTGNNLQSALLIAAMLPLIMIVVNLSSVAVVWFGGHRVYSGEMNIGALTAFIAYIMQILLAIMMAMYVLTTAPRAAACAERLNAVLEHPAVRPGRRGRRRHRAPQRRGGRRESLRQRRHHLHGCPFRLSRCRKSGAAKHQLYGKSRHHRCHHRLNRQRQINAARSAAPVPGYHCRNHHHRRPEHPYSAVGRPPPGHGCGPAAVLSVHRDHRPQSADRRPGGQRQSVMGGAGNGPGRRVRPRSAPRDGH